jgi:hypothetical protein
MFVHIIMPYKTRKVRGKNCYRVSNKNTHRVYSKCASAANARRQLRLLRAIENNKNFVPNSMLMRKTRKTRRNK